MIRAIIFDFDGLILDTEGPDYQSWKELFESYGCQLPFSRWASLIGTMDGTFDPALELENQSGQKLDWEQLEPRRFNRALELISSQAVMPGVLEYLIDGKRLGLKIGIASNSSIKWITGHLSRLGLLEYFDVILGQDHVHITKPDPALYLAALEALEIRYDQAIAFEDSPNGIRAAKGAKIFCIAVPNQITAQLPLDLADMLLDSLAVLPLEMLLQEVGKRRSLAADST